MEKSIVYAVSLVMLLVSSQSWSVHVGSAFGGNESSRLEILELSESELKSTEGELSPPVIYAIAITGAAVTGGILAAIEQYDETGEIKAGPIVARALLDASMTAINIGAALTRSAVPIVTALGLDIAVYSSLAFAKDPEVFSGSPESLQSGYLEFYNPDRVASYQAHYENGTGVSLDLDLTFLGEVSDPNWSPGSGSLELYNGGLSLSEFNVVVGDTDTIYTDGTDIYDTSYLYAPVGAGERHYKYF